MRVGACNGNSLSTACRRQERRGSTRTDTLEALRSEVSFENIDMHNNAEMNLAISDLRGPLVVRHQRGMLEAMR